MLAVILTAQNNDYIQWKENVFGKSL